VSLAFIVRQSAPQGEAMGMSVVFMPEETGARRRPYVPKRVTTRYSLRASAPPMISMSSLVIAA
jgi:hypothetical protein